MATRKKDKGKLLVGLIFMSVGLITCLFLKHINADTAITAGFVAGIGYVWTEQNS